jgi:hypothetical protein
VPDPSNFLFYFFTSTHLLNCCFSSVDIATPAFEIASKVIAYSCDMAYCIAFLKPAAKWQKLLKRFAYPLDLSNLPIQLSNGQQLILIDAAPK